MTGRRLGVGAAVGEETTVAVEGSAAGLLPDLPPDEVGATELAGDDVAGVATEPFESCAPREAIIELAGCNVGVATEPHS